MAAISEKELKIIKRLNKIREKFISNTNENIINKHGLTERITEFQKPVTDTLKQTNTHLKQISDQPKHKIRFPITEGHLGRPNNSYFVIDLHDERSGDSFFRLKHNSNRLLKINKDGEMTVYNKDGEEKYFRKPSEGLQQLLFNPSNNINLELVDESDIANYIQILKHAEINPGNKSKRIKNIIKHFENDPILNREFNQLTIGEGLNCEVPIDLTNKNPIQLFHDLSLLKAAKQAGNTNTLGKANIILDRLKELKSISSKKYEKLLKSFN